ncbi:unnamed protein product, partial [Polarella glacialis]
AQGPNGVTTSGAELRAAPYMQQLESELQAGALHAAITPGDGGGGGCGCGDDDDDTLTTTTTTTTDDDDDDDCLSSAGVAEARTPLVSSRQMILNLVTGGLGTGMLSLPWAMAGASITATLLT